MRRKQLDRCKHAQRRSIEIHINGTEETGDRNCIVVRLRCKDCGGMQELIADRVKVDGDESIVSASVAKDTGWKIPRVKLA